MNRGELFDIVNAAPSAKPLDSHEDYSRRDYIGQRCGQLFGWVTGPDQLFLCDWLPKIATEEFGGVPMRMIEVGTFAGSTARGLIALTVGGSILCIDDMSDVTPFLKQSGKATCAEVWESTLQAGVDLSAYATLLEGDSRQIGKNLHTQADLVLVDAKHDYEYAIEDITNFAPKVVRGGYCLVDDYDMTGVLRACGEFFKPEEWETIRTPSKPQAKLIVYRRK